MNAIINGKKYDTKTAQCIADNEFADGSNRLRGGRGSSLYATKKGNFFAHHETCWQGERDVIEPLTLSQAKSYFEELQGDPDVWAEIFGPAEEA